MTHLVENIVNRLTALWSQLTGRELRSDIAEIEERIVEWMNIYKGRQSWLKYHFFNMLGRREECTRKTMNAAKLICAEIAGLVWAEEPEIVASEGIEQFLYDNKFCKNMRNLTEYGAAAGGFALKLRAVDGKLVIDFVSAEFFIPVSWDNVQIFEADFISRKVEDKETYLYLERHRKTEGGYKIQVEKFLDDGGDRLKKIGMPSEVFIKTSVPLFVYIAYPGANNIIIGSPIGVSIFANAVDTLKSLDIAFDALSQEILLGRKRIIVPHTALRYVQDTSATGTGKAVRYFDPSDQVFVAFNKGDAKEQQILDNSVELRIEEIRLAVQTLLDILSAQCGFSVGAFSFDGQTMKTATEVISENSKTFKLKQRYENEISDGIKALVYAVNEIGAGYGIKTKKDGEVEIIWNDSIIEDRNSKTDYWLKRYNSKTCTLEDVLENLDGLSEEDAQSEAEKIKKQSASIDLDSVFGNGTA